MCEPVNVHVVVNEVYVCICSVYLCCVTIHVRDCIGAMLYEMQYM